MISYCDDTSLRTPPHPIDGLRMRLLFDHFHPQFPQVSPFQFMGALIRADQRAPRGCRIDDFVKLLIAALRDDDLPG